MGKFKTTLLGLLGITAGASAQCGSAPVNNNIKNVNVEEFEKKLATDSFQLIDVRTPAEFAESHLHGATNINVQDTAFVALAMAQLNKERPIAVYCRSGKRSAMACSILSKEGFKTINLQGGIIAWADEKKPLEMKK